MSLWDCLPSLGVTNAKIEEKIQESKGERVRKQVQKFCNTMEAMAEEYSGEASTAATDMSRALSLAKQYKRLKNKVVSAKFMREYKLAEKNFSTYNNLQTQVLEWSSKAKVTFHTQMTSAVVANMSKQIQESYKGNSMQSMEDSMDINE